MNSTNQATRRRPLPMKMSPADVPDYQATDREPGHEGNRPSFAATRDFVGADGKREKVDGPTNLNNNRLSMLKARGIIDDVQLAAGERLALDWEMSLIMPVANSVMVGNGGSGGSAQLPNDAKCAAMKRHGEARKMLGLAWAIVEAVCCKNLRIDEAASALHIHPRRATGQLETGLDVLALHYGLR